jgi:hypothetical protein
LVYRCIMKGCSFFSIFIFFFKRDKGGCLHFHTCSTSSELLKRFQWILVGMMY